MKFLKFSVSLLAFALLGSTAVLAHDSNKATLQLYEKVNVDGKALNPGTYKVDWQGSGPNVQVSIKEGKDVVATFPAHVTEQPTKNDNDAYGSTAGPDGTRVLTTIYVGGQRTALNVAPASAQKASASHASGAE